MNRALIIKQPWIELILIGQKTWEMRSRPTNIRGRIGLIEQGTGLIVGEAELVDSLPKLTYSEKTETEEKHHLPNKMQILKKYSYPWVLKNVKRYEQPIPYKHPQGAVTWVRLDKLK